MTSRTLARTSARIAVLVALGGAITSCSGGEEPAATTEEDAAVDPAEDTAEDEDATGDDDPQDAGDAGSADVAAVSLPYTEELQGRRLTVESFGTSAPAPDAEDFWEVADGNEAFYVQVRMENVEAEPWEFNMVQFFLFDESGEDYGTEFFPVEAGEVPEARMLDVGDAVEGYIPFEVPAGQTGLRLEVAVDLSAGDVITVQLN